MPDPAAAVVTVAAATAQVSRQSAAVFPVSTQSMSQQVAALTVPEVSAFRVPPPLVSQSNATLEASPAVSTQVCAQAVPTMPANRIVTRSFIRVLGPGLPLLAVA